MIRNPFRNLDHKKLSRSSDILKSQNDYYKIVNRRIFIFSIVICVLFSFIAVRLVFVQIYDKESYTVKLENYSSNTETDAASRGQIFDRHGNVIAKTVASHNIIYFPPKGVTKDEQWKLAQKFAKQFTVSIDNMTTSDYQDLYIFLHKGKDGEKDGGTNLLKKGEELLEMEKQEKLIRSRITEEMVNELADEQTKKSFVVYLAMRKLPSKQNKVVIEDASEEDVAYLTENKDQYQGFNVDLGSWKREYPYGDTLRDVLGSVTTSKQGVPAELKTYYEAKGYSMTSRVGQSGLEQQYEELLAGTPRVSEINYDEDGTALLNEISSGKKGYDLHLTIDIELQQKLDDVITSVLEKYTGSKGREAFDRAIVVIMDPQTGDVLAMSGKYVQDGKIYNYSSAAYTQSYEVGSVVKGATVYMALQEGVQTRSSIEDDAPMKIAGTGTKSSFLNYGPVNAIKALEVSSNVYMFKSVIKLAGGNYVYDQPLNVSNEKWTEVQKTMRNYYSMFGLGTKTLLDVPNEAIGFRDYSVAGGRLMDYSIGQYDNYTPIQLAQYVTTIANGGKKLQPHLVSYATEVNADYKVMENKTNVLSTLTGDNSSENLATVQDGFRSCVAAGHCGNLGGLEEPVAAKTGTAEVESIYTNASLIGFAPYGGEAKVSFACTAPKSSTNNSAVEANICGSEIMPQILAEFFKKY
ncbi:peptidoglycan D,D-transpeptidase FtsI family protein [Amedibacillus sp. YH-ame6]